MIIILRIVFAVGLLVALAYAIGYLRLGNRRHLVNAFWALIVTGVLGLIFFAGLVFEKLIS
ncbi:MAG: hypothetical protein ACRBC3_08035 [Burkholderiaceae bacterium]